jgi:hypothetical protein
MDARKITEADRRSNGRSAALADISFAGAFQMQSPQNAKNPA